MQIIKHDIARKRTRKTVAKLGLSSGSKLGTKKGTLLYYPTTEASLKVQEAICPRCEAQSKLRLREFSDQALSALLVWGEMGENAVGVGICDDCYDELRDVLIERQEEIFNPRPPEQQPVRKQAVAANKETAVVSKAATATTSKASPSKAATAAKTTSTTAKKPSTTKTAASKSKPAAASKGKKADTKKPVKKVKRAS